MKLTSLFKLDTKLSVTKYFVIFVFSISILVSFIYVYFSWRIYSENSLSSLKSQTDRIERSFIDTIDYTAYLMNYLNTQIKKEDHNNLRNINKLLSSFRLNPEVNTKIPWNMFSWSDDRFDLVVNSDYGITKPVSIKNRDYIIKIKKDPSKIQLGESVHGRYSGKWIIPAGLALTDEEESILGVIVFGIQIEHLVRKMENAMNRPEISFAIYRLDNMKLVMNSNNFTNNSKHIELVESIKGKKESSGELSKYSVFSSGGGHSHYRKLDKYPYVLVTKYDYTLVNKQVFSRLFPYLFEVGILFCILFIVLLALKYVIVKPIVRLSKAAEAISHDRDDEVDKILPDTKIQEISNLCEQLRAVEQYKLDLIEAKKSQERFFANMSHELRTPLNGIINFTAMMQKELFGPVSDDYKDMLGDIYTSADHLLTLVNDILDFSKMDLGKMSIIEDKFNMVQEIEESVKLVTPDAQKNGVTLSYNIQSDLKMFYGDRRMFKQIILNLLSNAIKFSKAKGKVELILKTNEKENLALEVTDNGIGIRKEDMSQIAKEFGQAQDAYKRGNRQGTGLGLVITKKMAELHKGSFNIESIYNSGTVVTITFPKDRLK